MIQRAETFRTGEARDIGLPAEALARIGDAVTEAEARTAAEILVVVASAPLVQHRFYSVMWAALLALVLPWIGAIFLVLRDIQVLSLQAVIFVVLAGVLMLPQVAPHVVPRPALRAAARAAAIELFLAHGVPQTEGRTGILIFAAARERLVEVVADDGVHEILGHAAWRQICEAVSARAAEGSLADGLVEGVRLAGDLLAGPLPPRADDENELENHVIVL